MHILIRQAEVGETGVVSRVLTGAAEWLRERGTPMWKADELNPERVAGDVAAGLFFVAEVGGEIAGTVKFQLEDLLFWPDQPTGEAAYVHRLAIRREFAGGQVSAALMNWAAKRARSLGRRYVRLDCEASRQRLRAVYERLGFRHHSDRQVGPYFVSRYELPLAAPMEFRVHGLDHVQLAMPAGQEEEARKFYAGLLGMIEVPKPANLAKRGGAWFESGTLRVHLGVEMDFRPAKKAHPAFLVKDLPALITHLEREGVPIARDEPLEGYHRIYVADPFCNRIELLEPITPTVES
jgi:GNAT superfamily N-acetyltransferase/catechol 2,3-dioxygenase-like lactoylglutathione lyase family enzyme